MLSLAFRDAEPSTSRDLVLLLATSNWGTPSEETLEAMRTELRGLGAALRLSTRDDERVSVSLLASDGAEMFHLMSSVDDVTTALLEALLIAGQSARLQEGSHAHHSEREVVFYSLVGALSLVFADGCGPASQPRGAPPTALA